LQNSGSARNFPKFLSKKLLRATEHIPIHGNQKTTALDGENHLYIYRTWRQNQIVVLRTLANGFHLK
jgi:hypothetical protein